MSKRISNLLGLSLLFVILACSGKKTISDKEIRKLLQVSDGAPTPEILMKKQVNLDENPDFETLVLSRVGNEETLSAIKKSNNSGKEEYSLIFKKTFAMLNSAPLDYSKEEKKWIPAAKKNPGNDGNIIRRILLGELPGDTYNSIFTEVMTEEPQLGLASVPFAYRKGVKIFDGLSALKEHEYLKSSRRGDFSYDSKEKSMKIFPENPSYTQEIVFNGWEMVPLLTYLPIPSLVSAKYNTAEGKLDEYEVRIEMKNRGGYCSSCYLTFSMPSAVSVKPAGKGEGYQVYKKGAGVYHYREKKTLPAKDLILEITKQDWSKNYKYYVAFIVKASKDWDKKILFRLSTKANRMNVYSPNESSSVPTVVDGQGFYSYEIPLTGEK